jgi:hypothetical protein
MAQMLLARGVKAYLVTVVIVAVLWLVWTAWKSK